MLALRLTPDVEARLAALADRTGRTKNWYARTAIEAYLDEMEDFFLEEERMAAFVPGSAVPLEQLKRDLALDD
jgi:RHH-type rel operon transcriptional repressor/antitoxin RelB